MQFLLSHWHCILSIAAIVIAMFFLRDKPGDKSSESRHDEADDKHVKSNT